MGRPTPVVLYSQTFRHGGPDEHVDEVRFAEPVLITAFEILEQQTPSMCKSVSLTGVSSPASFALEIFVRSGGEARFKRLCPPFVYSASAPSLRDAQVAVTDHLVLRGTYDAVTLILYGNLASSIGHMIVDRDEPSSVPDVTLSEMSYKFDDLPEALHPQRTKAGVPFSPVQSLGLICTDNETTEIIRKVLRLAGQLGRLELDSISLHKVVKSLVTAAASLRISESWLLKVPLFDLWPVFLESAIGEDPEKKGLNLLLDAKVELQELYDQLRGTAENNPGDKNETVQQLDEEKENDAVKAEISDLVLELLLHWIQGSVQSSGSRTSAIFPVESLIGGLAAAQLLCTHSRECYRFVLAGGLHLLMDVLQHVVGSFSATTLLALGAVECASRYAFGCEALLGWWNPDGAPFGENVKSKGPSKGYSVLMKFVLQPRQQPVVQLAARVLHRLRAYELTTALQTAVEIFIEEPLSKARSSSEKESGAMAVANATALIKQLVGVLNIKDIFPKESPSHGFSHWLALEGEGGGTLLPPAFGSTTPRTSTLAMEDIDTFLLSVLQEKRLLPLLVILMSAPRLRSLQGQAMIMCTELLGVVEMLFLKLLSCRSGLLFLAHDTEVASAFLGSFQRLEESHEKDLVPLRHAIALTSAGFLCHPQDFGKTFRTYLSVISVMDRLLGSSGQSEESLWALWDLSAISRVESGRQALLILPWFPEVMNLLVGALHTDRKASSKLVLGETWRRAGVHFIAEVLQVVVSDTAAATVAAWIPHAVAMQQGLLASTAHVDDLVTGSGIGDDDKDVACSRLLEWLEPAVVYHKKGAVGLLKYASAILAGGGGIVKTGSGLSPMENMDTDTSLGDQAANTDVLHAAAPYQGKLTGVEGTPPLLSDTAIVQMTVAFRILALVSSYAGVAAVLYEDGAMTILQSVLKSCSSALQSSSSAYDAVIDEEDIDYDGTADDIGDHAKEHLLLGLLTPALMFVLALLQDLQAAVSNYQNTKLVDVLLSLHHQMSSRIASYVCSPPYTWSGITSEFVAVRQVLASVLVCWPIFGWTPSLFFRLLGINNSSNLANPTRLPMEPSLTCSVLSLLADMLPVESPQLCNTRASLSDMYRSLALDNIIGPQSASAVRWHIRPPHSEQFMQDFTVYIDQISDVVVHHASTACGILQHMQNLVVIRLACTNVDYAAIIVRLILGQIRDQNASGVYGPEKESLQVERLIQSVTGLALHPASKQVLLREGTVDVLLKAFEVRRPPSTGDVKSLEGDVGVSAIGQWLWIVKAFSALCDPDISSAPLSSLERRTMEDCPSFKDCCAIASCLFTLLQKVPIGKEFEVVAEGFTKLSSHKLGRAAIGFVCIQRRHLTSSSEGRISTESGTPQNSSNGITVEEMQEKPEDHKPPLLFLDLWLRVKSALESNKLPGSVITSVIRQFAVSSLVLSAAGKSICGMAALVYLLGLDQEFSKEEILAPIMEIAALLNVHDNKADAGAMSTAEASCLSSVPASAVEKAHASVMAMLRIVKRPEVGRQITEKALVAIQGYSAAPSTRSTNPRRVKPPPNMFAATALALSIKQDGDLEKEAGTLDDIFADKEPEIPGLDSRGKMVWECPPGVHDRAVLPRSSMRKTVEVTRKRHGTENSNTGSTPSVDGLSNNGAGLPPGSSRPLPASAGAGSALNRRDTFRQRKPNTSRPPSMHVDDYVARERSELNTSGSSPVPPPIQRTASGSGRPPSIHVDEFMAKQQERQLLSATSSGIIDEQQLLSASRNAATDSNKRSVPEVVAATSKRFKQEEDGLFSSIPTQKGSKQQWEEVSVADSIAVGRGGSNEILEPSRPSDSAPSAVADERSEGTSSSSSSISTPTDPVHSFKPPPPGADMLLIHSKASFQTTAARSPAGALQATQTHELRPSGNSTERLQVRDGGKRMSETVTYGGSHPVADNRGSFLFTEGGRFDPRQPAAGGDRTPVPFVPTNPQPSESQVPKAEPANMRQSSTPFSLHPGDSDAAARKPYPSISSGELVEQPHLLSLPPPSDFQLRDPFHPIQGGVGTQKALREIRQLPPSPAVHSAQQQLKEAAFQNVGGVSQAQSSPFTAGSGTHQGLQVMQPGATVLAGDHRTWQSSPGPNASSYAPAKAVVSSSQATDPRPRPPEKQGDRTAATNVQPRLNVSPSPAGGAGPWPQDASQPRLDPQLSSSLLNLLASRPSSSYAPPLPRRQWPSSGEAVAKGGTSDTHTLEGPWPGQAPPRMRYRDEAGTQYGLQGRSGQPPGIPPVPVGHNAPHHGGAIPFPAAHVASPHQSLPPAPLPPPPLPSSLSLKGATVLVDNVPVAGHTGSHASPRDSRFPDQAQSYNPAPPPLGQPMSYVPPPVPAGKPSTTLHGSQASINIPPAHQQQLHMPLQQQNLIQLQQQQLQTRQQLQQHIQSPQIQQRHHQLGPIPMSVQVPLGAAPTPAPPLPSQPPPPPSPALAAAQSQGPAAPTLPLQSPHPPRPPSMPAPGPGLQQPQQRPQQQDASPMLQQMLASPDAIQALLKDQNKLRELLEKHPKLISLLQERMSQAPP